MRTSCVCLVLLAVLWPLPVLAAQGGGELLGPRGLSCRDPMPALRRGSFDLPVGQARLWDGKGCLAESGSPCAWSVELTKAEQWGSGRSFLLVTVTADHVTGSGAWDWIFVYQCRSGAYTQVFAESFLYGGAVELGVRSDFWVTAGQWAPNDPTCCPSSLRRTRHAWDARQGRFIVAESEDTPSAGP